MQAQQASSPYVREITDIATRVQKLWQVPAMAVTVVFPLVPPMAMPREALNKICGDFFDARLVTELLQALDFQLHGVRELRAHGDTLAIGGERVDRPAVVFHKHINLRFGQWKFAGEFRLRRLVLPVGQFLAGVGARFLRQERRDR